MKLSWPKRSRPAPPEVAAAPTVPPADPFVIDADLLSDVGCVRTNNEDSGRIIRLPNAVPVPGPGPSPGPSPGSSHDRVLVVVADGMGGHNAGEVASALAAETLETAFPTLGPDPATPLRHAVENANHRIYADAENSPEHNGMGTTCTALLLQDGNAFSAHVGDSRIYLLRNGGIYLVSEDHSQVMEMVKAGVLTMAQARHHPDKNIITRALGRQPQVDVATWPQPMPVQAGDGFLLCSDGLCDVLEDDEMNAVAQSLAAAEACEELVRLAKTRNAADNITVAVIKLLPLHKPAEPAVATDEVIPKHPTSSSRPTRRVEIAP